jgi:hypothetical protein
LDSSITTYAHEIFESVSDPDIYYGWRDYDDDFALEKGSQENSKCPRRELNDIAVMFCTPLLTSHFPPASTFIPVTRP